MKRYIFVDKLPEKCCECDYCGYSAEDIVCAASESLKEIKDAEKKRNDCILREVQEVFCCWRQQEESSGEWETDCGNAFWLNDGTPEKNEMKYCTYCGKPLIGIEYTEDG